MGISKTNFFTEPQNQQAILFKALGHPARIAIVEYLLSVNSCICGDIVNEIPLSQPTISQHLKELKNAQIIQGTIEGNAICYCINEDKIAEIQQYFSSILKTLELKKSNCC